MKNAVITFGYHDQSAPRHWNMVRKWKAHGTQVLECHTTKKGLIGKYTDLTGQFRQYKKDTDTVLVTFPGHYLMPLAWFLTRFPRKRLVFDAFISLSDTLVSDRGKVSWVHPYAWFLYLVDFFSCHMADEVLVDTKAHRDFFIHRFKLRSTRVKVVYLGARTDVFFPQKTEKNPNRFDVLFYGTYIPLQGIEYIIGAASLLQGTHPHIQFTLIGSGQTYKHMRTLAERKDVHNVAFQKRVPLTELPERIRGAHLNLGVFGISEKTKRVIPHKVYDALACGMHVLTADTPAIHEQFQDNEHLHLCRAGSATALAESIARLSTEIQ
ncbi:hypothetical protein COU76_03935 [Candidatus Peregrinibacteria bacterium CG10_big_fil_rev_8_21_14_0_10_49_10]|nr:MAG: hypothetical protein COU76_03935 [Candidatus Peregrinibacteria bacterium CG10_big_fil_rev_8_21_14_0_10_49_10]